MQSGGGRDDEDPNDLLTPSEAAKLLGVSADTVRLYADAGKLAALRTQTGRRFFRRSEVERLVAARASGPKTRSGRPKGRK